MSITVKSLDERIDGVEERLNTLVADFAEFRAEVRTSLAIIKWVGATVAGLAILSLFQAFSVANQAGKLESALETSRKLALKTDGTVVAQGQALAAMTEQTKAPTAASQRHDAAIAEQGKAIVALTEQVRALTAATQKSDAATAEQFKAISATLAEQAKLTQQLIRDVAELKPKGKP